MKLPDILILAASAAFLIIGIYEIITFGIGSAYWSIMLSVMFFFLFTYRKKNNS